MKSKQQKTYKAVIIGAGKIASVFDSPASKNVLTHAHALTLHPRVKLVGMTDIDTRKGKKEARKWKTDFYSDAKSMVRDTTPDIVVIATPDSTHLPILLDLMRKNIPFIICEKPVVTKLSDIAKVRLAAKQSTSKVVVNFRRRFDPIVESLRNDLVSKKYGPIISANAIYGKGIMHNGIHFIDLARYFFGEMISGTMLFRTQDHPTGAPSLGGIATFERCPQFYLMVGDGRAYSLAEFEIRTTKRRFRLIDEGFRLLTEEVIFDPVFKGDRMLGNGKIMETGLIHSMSALADEAVSILDGKRSTRATLLDALTTHETGFTLLKSNIKK
jgi:predicted dehydrogenase